MTDRAARAWLIDARNFAQEAHNLTVRLNRETFEAQRQIQLAVFFCLAAAGEALNQVPKDVQALAPEIPWMAINGLRNRLVHGFWLIDLQIVLRIAQDDTVALVSAIDQLIETIE